MAAPTTIVNPEYLRRNLAVCSGVGTAATLDAVIRDLSTLSRPPKGLIKRLRGALEAHERTGVVAILATYRAQVPVEVQRS